MGGKITFKSKFLLSAGFTMVEMLVVVFIFSILAILVTQATSLSLRGSRKSESIGVVRENVEYAMNVIERRLRNARGFDCETTGNQLNYFDEYWEPAQFSCENVDGDTFIASDLARLTSNEIWITNCPGVFSLCNDSTIPHSVEITVSAEAVGVAGAEGAQVTSSTRILLRNY